MSEFVGAPESATHQGTVHTHQVNGQGQALGGSVQGAPEMNKDSISKKLSKVSPSRTPLDTFLRNIQSGKTDSDKYGFYSVVSRGTMCVVKSEFTVTVGEATDWIELTSGWHHLSKDGNLMLPDYNVSAGVVSKMPEGLAAPHPLVLHIVDIDRGMHKIRVVAVNGNVTSSTPIAADSKMYRMASAKDRLAAISDDPMATPTKEYNFCQRNICTISESVYQALQEKEIEYGMAEFHEQALADFRYQAEVSSIFGAQPFGMDGDAFVDPLSQKQKIMMRGLLDFNIQHLPQTDGQSIDNYLNAAMEALFAVNNGSEERLILYGPGFSTAMANSKWWTKQLEAKNTEIKFGVRWKMIESNFGVLRAVYAPVLGLLGAFSNSAIVIDPNNLRRVNQVPLFERKLNLQDAGVRNTNDVVLEESITLEVTNPTTHGLLSII